MPFLRLVIIYIVVILAAVLFFQRDAVMGMLGLSFEDNEPEAAMAPAASGDTAPPATIQETAPSTETASTQEMQTPTPTAGATTVPTQSAPEQPTATANAPQPLQTPVAEQQPATQAPASEQPADDTVAAGLETARKAYWAGDQVGAETAYLALVKEAPENADALGELGNLYYGQRKYSAAAEYYYRAGLQLLKDGDKGRVNALVGVLQSIAPQKAADLRARLNQ